MRFVTIVAAAAALLTAAPVAGPAGTELGPQDFEVTAAWAPEIGSASASSPSCSTPQPPDFVVNCTVTWTHSVAGTPISGTVTRRTDGQNGGFSATCDWEIAMTNVAVEVKANEEHEIESARYTAFDGHGSQSCSWSIRIGADGLVGTFTGRDEISLASENLAALRGSLSVTVVSGSGEWEKAVGSGGLVQQAQFQLPDVTRFLPLRALQSLRAGDPMSLTLRAGPPRAQIVVPSKTLARDSKYRLHLAAKAGSTCAATAAGARKVTLGKAADGNKDGTILFSRALAPQLGTGTWTVTAACAWKGGKASAKTTLRVG